MERDAETRRAVIMPSNATDGAQPQRYSISPKRTVLGDLWLPPLSTTYTIFHVSHFQVLLFPLHIGFPRNRSSSMTSRDVPTTDRTKGRRAGERSAAHSPSLPSQHRSSTKSYTNGAQKPSKSMTTALRSRPDQGEESDHAQSSSDVSMEDDSEKNPRKPPPPAQLGDVKRYAHGNTKSAGQFMDKLGRWVDSFLCDCSPR